MNAEYLLYGLHVAADVEIPGLLAIHNGGEPDLRVRFTEWPSDLGDPGTLGLWFPGPETSEAPGIGHRIYRSHDGDFFLVSYPDGTEFAISGDGRGVWVRWQPPLTLEDAVTYLVGPIVGFLLRRKGQLCLHAGCVGMDDAAIAIAGTGGAGKSTTVSAFALERHPVLSDDITPIHEQRGGFFAVPGYPRLCLWPESATALFGRADALPQITPSWEKRFFAVGGRETEFGSTPLPLRAIYVLSDREDSDRAPSLAPLSPERAFLMLIGHTYANNRLDPEMRAAEFANLDRLVRRVPVRVVTPHASIERIGALVSTIVADVRAMPGGARP